MTLSLENKQGGKLKRWSLTTALWPRETEATVACEQRCNIPLGMRGSVCVHTLLFVFQWYHIWNVTVLCLNVCLCLFQRWRSYSNNVQLRAKWKHCDKRNLVDTHSSYPTLLDAKLNVSMYHCQETSEKVSVLSTTNSLIWTWHTSPVGRVLPGATPVTPCCDSQFTSQPRP